MIFISIGRFYPTDFGRFHSSQNGQSYPPLTTETRLKYLNTYRFLVFVLVADLGFTMTTGSDYSPLYGHVSLAVQAKKQADREAYIRSQPDMSSMFYSEKIKSGTDKPAELPEKPNVILIFTEGLS